jgi:hypothetical protein
MKHDKRKTAVVENEVTVECRDATTVFQMTLGII